MVRTFKGWCDVCGKVNRFSFSPNPGDHNKCRDCGTHLFSCTGCMERKD